MVVKVRAFWSRLQFTLKVNPIFFFREQYRHWRHHRSLDPSLQHPAERRGGRAGPDPARVRWRLPPQRHSRLQAEGLHQHPRGDQRLRREAAGVPHLRPRQAAGGVWPRRTRCWYILPLRTQQVSNLYLFLSFSLSLYLSSVFLLGAFFLYQSLSLSFLYWFFISVFLHQSFSLLILSVFFFCLCFLYQTSSLFFHQSYSLSLSLFYFNFILQLHHCTAGAGGRSSSSASSPGAPGPRSPCPSPESTTGRSARNSTS